MLIRPRMQVRAPSEAGTWQKWSMLAALTIWMSTILAVASSQTDNNFIWCHADGSAVDGVTYRKTRKSTASSGTQTESITLAWHLTRDVSFLRISVSLSTRADRCRPLEARTEEARPLTAHPLPLHNKGKYSEAINNCLTTVIRRFLIWALSRLLVEEKKAFKIKMRLFWFILFVLFCFIWVQITVGGGCTLETAAIKQQQHERTGRW